MRFSQRVQRRQRRGLPEEMHGDDGPGARRDLSRHIDRINEERARINIRKDNLRAHLMDRFRRSDVGEGRGDDFVTRSDLQRAQRQGESVRAGVHADAEARASVGGNLLLERGDVRAKDVVRASEDFLDGGQQFSFERLVLRREIQEGDLHRVSGGFVVGAVLYFAG